MPNLPNRCQHLKVNGTLCGSPALRRNRFCYFHKLHHEETIKLNQDRTRRRPNAAITLPVLEDANSIQVSLMQIMRLIIAGQIDGKTAGLLLYALQTASSNLPRTNFQPYLHDVVLDVKAVDQTPLGSQIWSDGDFATDEEEDEAEEESREDFISRTPAATVTPAGRAVPLAQVSPPYAKRPPAKPTLDEVRKKVTAQIKNALPAIAAAVGANGRH